MTGRETGQETGPANTPPEDPPVLPGWWRLFIAVNPSGPRWPGALRAALALALPASVALLLGHQTAMLMIAGGGFAVIFGEGLPFRARWRVMSIVGALLACGAMAGAMVGTVVWQQESHCGLLLIVVFTSAVAAVSGFVQNALRLPPPGTFFIVMVAGGSTMIARQGVNPVEVGLWTSLGALCAVLIGMVPALWGRRRPETAAVTRLEQQVEAWEAAVENTGQNTVAETHRVRVALAQAWYALSDAGLVAAGRGPGGEQHDLVGRCLAAQRRIAGESTVPLLRPSVRYRIFRSMTPNSHAMTTAVKIGVASLVAGTVGVALGFDRPDWAIVTAMVILQWGPDLRPGTVRAAHRVVGSVAGVLLFAGFHLLELDGWSLLAALALCQFLAEVLVVRNYAFTVTVVTPLAMMMGGAMHQPLGPGVVSRIAEVGIATACAIASLWLIARGADKRRVIRQRENCLAAMTGLLGRLVAGSVPHDALVQRRDLQFELLWERRDAEAMATNRPSADPDGTLWQGHLLVQRCGYRMLDRCASAGNRKLGQPELAELAEATRQVVDQVRVETR
ncbi:MAG: FUSC family protein [Corynebacterium sp.]|nr:FUSC family protein [Corynebacterium sp.]